MPVVNAYQHVFPVIGGELSSDGRSLLMTEVYGTAFSLGGKYWMTAGHVLRSAATHPIVGLGFVSGKQWMTTRCARSEVIESYDVGVFEAAERVEAETLGWLDGELSMMTPVFSVGFPYALNRDLTSINLRAFRGHVVSAATGTMLQGRPRVYELQFQCPRGLSGAPLVFEGSRLFAAGIVVGNATSQMLVLADREVVAEGQTTILERYEMLQLGIAVQSDAVGPLRSDVLGTTVQEYLASKGLVERSV